MPPCRPRSSTSGLSEYKSSLQAYDKKIDELQTQIDGDNAQATNYRQRLGIAADIEGMRAKLQELTGRQPLNTLLADGRTIEHGGLARRARNRMPRRRAASWAPTQAERKTFVEHWNGQISQDLADTRGKLVHAQQRYTKADLHNQLVVLTRRATRSCCRWQRSR